MRPPRETRRFNVNRFVTGVFLALGCLLIIHSPARAQSLKSVPVPEPPTIWKYVTNQDAARQLGKALFWDMQVGSDGMTACATCHFHAGTDSRIRNTLNPDTLGGDTLFGAGGPNSAVTRADFPFVEFFDPRFPVGFTRDVNDIIGSQGVVMKDFVDIVIGSAEDIGTPVVDPVFNFQGVNVRQVTGRNSPTVINSVYNFAGFWDGRANNVFNGVDSFGAMDPDASIFVVKSGTLTPTTMRIRNGSLASQAMSPPVNSMEMSWKGRTWPKIGKKMLSLRPLGKQVVHPQDSELGILSRSGFRPNGTVRNIKGLNRNYKYLIRQAFPRRFWASTVEHLEFIDPSNPQQGLHVVAGPADPNDTNQFTQMEANFSFFFGLSVQLYLSTLVSDESPFDRFMEEVAVLGASNALTLEQQSGMAAFNGIGGCLACHVGAEFTGAAVSSVLPNPNPPDPGIPVVPDPRKNPLNAVELMAFTIGDALYDVDFLNTTVVRTGDDPGRSGRAPFVNPLTGQNYPLGWSELALLKRDGFLPAEVAKFTPDLPVGFQSTDTGPTPNRVVSDGALKVPTLRNVALTGPYFHNGGMATLMQVVDFYSRGGNFPVENELEKPVQMSPLPFLRDNDNQQRFMVAFLQALTDRRVEEESGPFDHPQLFVPHGVDPTTLTEIIEEIPPVGALGRLAEGEQVLTPFLNVNHSLP